MKSWSFYDSVTGRLSPKHASGPDDWRPNIPASCAAIEGIHDHLSQRVDVDTGQVIDWQPLQPDADHEWNTDSRRWQLKVDVAATIERDLWARHRIQELEAKQARRVREILAADDPTLTAIDQEIATLRDELRPRPEPT